MKNLKIGQLETSIFPKIIQNQGHIICSHKKTSSAVLLLLPEVIDI